MSQVSDLHEWNRNRNRPLASGVQIRRSVAPENRILEAGPVQMMNMSHQPNAVIDPAVPQYAVHLVLRTPPLLQVGFNRAPRWLVMSSGVFVAAPPNTAGEFIDHGPSHVLTMMIPKACADDFMQDSGARVEVRREETFRKPRVADQLIRLWHALADDRPGSRLFADQVMREVLHALAERTEERTSVRNAPERLAPRTVRHVRDFVEGSLTEELDVAMMANVAGMSPAHFARAFAATLGMTPFRYVMTRRLARAHELLECTRRSVLAIALDVGFKTPSHFTSRFRREFGLTPREIRSDLRLADEHLDENPQF